MLSEKKLAEIHEKHYGSKVEQLPAYVINMLQEAYQEGYDSGQSDTYEGGVE